MLCSFRNKLLCACFAVFYIVSIIFDVCPLLDTQTHNLQNAAGAAPPRGRGLFNAELLERLSVLARPQAERSPYAAGSLKADRWPDGAY